MHKRTKRTKGRKGARVIRRNVKVGPVAAADSILVKLRYPIRGTLAAAATVVSKRYTPNGAYDVDPVLGSTSTPGFAEYAALYTYYRVEHFRPRVTFSNLDNLSVSLYSVVSNTDPGTGGTNYQSYAQSAFGKTYELAPFYSGAGTVVHNQSVSVSKVLGMSTHTADSFRSVTTSIPSDLVYWGFGIYSNAGTNFANGVGYTGFIELTVRFYSRQDQLLSLTRPSGLEWEANRWIFKMDRLQKMKELVLNAPDPEQQKKDLEKRLKELVSLKLAQRSAESAV